MIIFIGFIGIVNAQELNVCNSGSCIWTNPPKSQILVCGQNAGSCLVNCNSFNVNGQCQDLIVYNLSPSLQVNCDYTDSCKNIKIYCGPFEPPNIQSQGLTSNDFNTATVNTCRLLTNTNFFNVGQYAQIRCSGDVTNCNAQSLNRGMNDIELYCVGITQSNSQCYILCQTNNGCNNNTIYCVSSPNTNCYKTGIGNNNIQIIYTISDSPTNYPTITPTQFPTNEPTMTPSVIPTITQTLTTTLQNSSNSTERLSLTPSSNPTRIPSETPTNGPTLTLSDSPTSIPTKSPFFEILTIAPTKTPLETSKDIESAPSTKSQAWIIILAVLLLLLLLLFGLFIYIFYLKKTQQKNNISLAVNQVSSATVSDSKHSQNNSSIQLAKQIQENVDPISTEGYPNNINHQNGETLSPNTHTSINKNIDFDNEYTNDTTHKIISTPKSNKPLDFENENENSDPKSQNIPFESEYSDQKNTDKTTKTPS